MSDDHDNLLAAIERQHADETAATRRKFVQGAASTIGALGLLALPTVAGARTSRTKSDTGNNTTENILNVAVTAEVLATIVNTIGWEKGLGGDAVTQRNIRAAAREELIHYDILRSFGAQPITKRIWVPDAVFANRTGLLSALEVGDQIFVNAYLIGALSFGNAGNGVLAAYAAEFMGVEAVHRALARQSLGKLGNDRAFMKFDQKERAPDAPDKGTQGFNNILTAVTRLQSAGFGFDAEGATPGAFYHFDQVKTRTPDDPDVNTRRPAPDA